MLYQIEAALREQRAGPNLWAAKRAHQSHPIVERFQRALVKLKTNGRHLPQSLLAGALEYTLGLWNTLTVYLADGRVEIDNNLVENAIRPTAIGNCSRRAFGVCTRPNTSCFKTTPMVGVVFIVVVIIRHL